MPERPKTVKPVTAVEVLARELRTAITSGQYEIGAILPSEREMILQKGVSRTTVREALRVLEGKGLIEIRRGRNGGSFVSRIQEKDVVQSLNFYLNGQDIRLADLVFARLAIEPFAAAQAALERTPEALDALREASLECELSLHDVPRFVEANLKWHLAVADASGNRLFITMLRSAYSALHEATDFEALEEKVRKAVIGVHWQIYNAIAAQDPDAAERRMKRHLQAYRDAMVEEEITLRSMARNEPGSTASA